MPIRPFEEVSPLELDMCDTTGDIIDLMSRCSFGARMLGEVARTLAEWAMASENLGTIIFAERMGSPLAELAEKMVRNGWFDEILTPCEYASFSRGGENALVIGNKWGAETETFLFARPKRAIFINQFGIARPGQVRDGYFPDVVFADPNYVLPVVNAFLEQAIERRFVGTTEFVEELGRYDGLAKEVHNAAKVLLQMFRDKETTIFLTASGAMTIAQMGSVISDILETGRVKCFTTTGALMAHGLVNALGMKHYKHDPSLSDEELARLKLNRVTDTLEPEGNLDHVAETIEQVLQQFNGAQPISPSELYRAIGEHLARTTSEMERGILKSAYRNDVLVTTPAFTDSEIGNDVLVRNAREFAAGFPKVLFDPERDTEQMLKIALGAKKAGIFTIGGGAPRNNVQNLGPLVEIMSDRLGLDLPPFRFSYGCRICPDEMYHGHLSGCTYSEGQSWRKMDPRGSFVEVHTDATLVLPFLVQYVLENL